MVMVIGDTTSVSITRVLQPVGPFRRVCQTQFAVWWHMLPPIRSEQDTHSSGTNLAEEFTADDPMGNLAHRSAFGPTQWHQSFALLKSDKMSVVCYTLTWKIFHPGVMHATQATYAMQTS
jgi:hypothetical protein